MKKNNLFEARKYLARKYLKNKDIISNIIKENDIICINLKTKDIMKKVTIELPDGYEAKVVKTEEITKTKISVIRTYQDLINTGINISGFFY